MLIGLTLSVVVLIARHDAGTIAGIAVEDVGSFAYHIALVGFIGGTVLVMFREHFSKALEAVLFWVLVGFVLALGYTYRTELRSVADRMMAEIRPGHAVTRGGRVVEIVRGRNGDFQVAVQVNGSRTAMVLDTGASAVVLTQEAAKSAGLPLEVLSYTVNVDTANGRTRAAAVTLDRLAVGDVVERKVPALIAQPGQLRVSLLGMSFLNRLQSWEVRGDRLVLRGQ